MRATPIVNAWGHVVEVTDPIAAIEKSDPLHPFLVFKTPGSLLVEAHLHDDRAEKILDKAVIGERITLKCLCEGLATRASC